MYILFLLKKLLIYVYIIMKIYVAFVIFMLGLYFCLNYTHKDVIENFNDYDHYKVDSSIPQMCPNLLVQKGSTYHLVNTKKAMIPGVNPIIFKDLGEYIEYAKWQQKMQKDCPVLYFQQTFDTQGKRGYKLLDDPINPKNKPLSRGGQRSELLHEPNNYDKLIDAAMDNKPYNSNMYAGYDEQDQQVGENTILDDKFTTSGRWNPMQSSWAGPKESERMSKELAVDRSRNIKEMEKQIHKVNSTDLIETQMNLLRPYNSRQMTKYSNQLYKSESKKKNELIKQSLENKM